MWPFSNSKRKNGETSGTYNPAQWLIEWLRGGAESASGVSVTPASAERQVTVFSCAQVLAQDTAKLPMVLYKARPGGGKDRVDEHPVARLLRERPNPRQTSYEFRSMQQRTLALRGNAYAWIERNGGGEALALWPIHPDRTMVKESPDYSIFYEIRRRDTDKAIVVPARDMLHLKENSDDGIVGRSAVSLLADSVGLAITGERHAGRVFKNGAKVSGVLTTPGHLTEEAQKNLKESFEKKFSDDNAYKTAVLEEGVSWTQVGMTSVDAQVLELLKFSRSQIAGIWRVPPHKIGDLDRATFSNIESQALEYVTDCLLAVLTNWEERLELSLLTDKERANGFFIKFKVDGLLRGDIKSRYAAYAIARMWGWLSSNEVRDFEDMNPIPGGDNYLEPGNMVDLNDALNKLEAMFGDDEPIDRTQVKAILRTLRPRGFALH